MQMLYIKTWLKAVLFMAFMVGAVNLQAQPIAEDVLDRVEVSSSGFTGIIKIFVRSGVRYISHTPTKEGTEIVMRVQVIQNNLLANRLQSNIGGGFNNDLNSAQNNMRESVVPHGDLTYGLEEVIYEKNLGQEFISFYFDKKVSFEVLQDSSFRSISVLIHDAK